MADFAWGHFWFGVIAALAFEMVCSAVIFWVLCRSAESSFRNENQSVDKIDPYISNDLIWQQHVRDTAVIERYLRSIEPTMPSL